MEEMRGARSVGRGVELPSPPGVPPSKHLQVFTNQEAHQTPSFWFFMETSLCRHD